METVFKIIHVLVCIGLIPVILLQSGKGGGVSATFGGGGSGTVFGSRGASTFLQRLTSVSAIVFMITSMTLSWYASQSRSVVGDESKDAAKASSKKGGENQVPMPSTTGTAAKSTPMSDSP
jgi:preprotein translocase subunit SecG